MMIWSSTASRVAAQAAKILAVFPADFSRLPIGLQSTHGVPATWIVAAGIRQQHAFAVGRGEGHGVLGLLLQDVLEIVDGHDHVPVLEVRDLLFDRVGEEGCNVHVEVMGHVGVSLQLCQAIVVPLDR
eukprot:5045920-Alexandrium_andersonii.AAC.1